jgi:putative heme-binding domain-containing protein
VLESFAGATDNWTKSAIIAAATDQAAAYVVDALAFSGPQALNDFVVAVVPAALPAGAERLLVAAAAAAPDAAALKSSIVRAIGRMDGPTPAASPTTIDALRKLLEDPATTAPALPIVAKWDAAGVLSASVDRHAQALLRELGDASASDDRRIDAAASLLAVPARRKPALAAIAPLLTDAGVAASLKGRLAATLGEYAGRDVDEVLVGALAKTMSTPVFDQIIRRPESTLLLLNAMEAEKVPLANLGPANIARLRTHPVRSLALNAAALLDALSPAVMAKADLVASLLPEVEKPGDAAKGRALFTGACATCHKLGDLGKIDVGPPLTGIGTHGRSELLTHIVDPNREVDPSFWQWNVTNRRGETLTGVIASENAATLVLRSPAGDVEIRKDDITNRENTRRSLMPEGLEALGAESLRDILTFLAGESQKFRIVDLRQAYSADSRRGFRREDERDETVTLNRFGDVSVAGVPFFVMDPARSASGNNLIALKGGPGRGNLSDDFPQRVVIPTSVTAASLHFLGGVGGWAWPVGGDAARGTPAMKIGVTFADGTTEEHVIKNGEVFADAFVRVDVPGSTDAGDFVRRGQLRYFALNLRKKGTLSKIVLESYDTDIVPATVAITAGDEAVAQRPLAPRSRAPIPHP